MKNLALLFLVACVASPVAEQKQAPVSATEQATVETAWWASAFDPEVIAARLEKGRIAESGEGEWHAELLDETPAYFRTYEEVAALLQTWQAQYPDLVEVFDLGPTGETERGTANRRVWKLRLGDKRMTNKTKALVYAGTHAREIQNPELVLRWAKELLEGYGVDAHKTATLLTRQIDVVPMVNPDGHVMVERGFAGDPDGDTWHRKTTTPPDGVDPNRNHPFHWGGAGASTSPYAQDYRGPKAGSEPEVRAMQANALAEMYPVAMDFHSAAELNMWPWGDTEDPAPDEAVLRAIGIRFTKWNGYSPVQSVGLYPTTGAIDDGTYGDTRALTMTIETGRSFLGDDEEFAETCQLNLPTIDYMIDIASSPKTLVWGPEVKRAQSTSGVLTADVEDFTEAPKAIVAAEWVDDPTAAEGSGHALQAADGKFDGVRETVKGTLADMIAGERLVFVRAKTSGGWGPLRAAWAN